MERDTQLGMGRTTQEGLGSLPQRHQDTKFYKLGGFVPSWLLCPVVATKSPRHEEMSDFWCLCAFVVTLFGYCHQVTKTRISSYLVASCLRSYSFRLLPPSHQDTKKCQIFGVFVPSWLAFSFNATKTQRHEYFNSLCPRAFVAGLFVQCH